MPFNRSMPVWPYIEQDHSPFASCLAAAPQGFQKAIPTSETPGNTWPCEICGHELNCVSNCQVANLQAA